MIQHALDRCEVNALGKTSAQVATAWVRQRDEKLIPIVGVRTLPQLQDLLGGTEVELSAAQLARLDEAGAGSTSVPGPTSSVDLRASWCTATSSRRSSCRARHRIGGGRRRCGTKAAPHVDSVPETAHVSGAAASTLTPSVVDIRAERLSRGLLNPPPFKPASPQRADWKRFHGT